MNGTPQFNKATVGAVLLAAVLIVIAAVYGNTGGESTENTPQRTQEVETVEALSRALTESDRDGDGLYDWEEPLWQTDPDNADTDGDGTNDGDEIAEGRDPTIPGPDDALPEPSDQQLRNEVASSSEDLTLTDQLARQFFTQYLQARGGGRSFGAASQQQLLTSMLGSASADQVAELPQYSVGDLTISDDTSREAVRTYGNAIGGAITRNSFETESEVFVMRRALDTRDQSEVEHLRRIASGYRGIAQDLLAVPVPENAAGRHLSLVNKTTALSATVQGMSGVLNDPLRALVSLRQYQPVSEETLSAIRDLQEYFDEQGVTFSPDEPGFVFQET